MQKFEACLANLSFFQVGFLYVVGLFIGSGGVLALMVWWYRDYLRENVA